MSQLTSQYRGLLQSNQTFADNVYSIRLSDGAVSGEFSHTQLFNPAASGFLALVFRVTTRCNIDSSIMYGLNTSALAASSGAGVSLSTFNGVTTDSDIDGILYTNATASRGTLFRQDEYDADANSVIVPFNNAIILDESVGLIISALNANVALTTTFEYIKVEK